MSGVDTRPVPVNIMAWPRVRDMITQQKFIYVSLYFNPDTTACGCYLLGVDRLAADLSMTAASLDDALDEFSRRGLIQRDKSTGEVFVVDWPRWHRFDSVPARGALWSSIAKIQSRDLWIKVESAYKSMPKPGKGKEKEKASSKEEGTMRLPAGWWRTTEGMVRADKLVGIEAWPGEDPSDFQRRIRTQLQAC
jgi:hypothetical protein